jgi:hypothetical protein
VGGNDARASEKLARTGGDERWAEDSSSFRVTGLPEARSYDPKAQTTPGLLADWAAIMRELRERKVIRTNNNPVGDIAEAIVHAYYGGQRGSFVQTGWDVRTPAGELIQVKALRQTPGTKRRNVSPIRDSDYDSVVIVIFDEDFRVTEGLKLDRELVEELFEIRPHVNGRVITVTDALRANGRVEKLTDLARAAQGVGHHGA